MKPTGRRAREALRSATSGVCSRSGWSPNRATACSRRRSWPRSCSTPRSRTRRGFAIATLVVSLPFSILGPFAGVFIDRWSRRKTSWSRRCSGCGPVVGAVRPPDGGRAVLRRCALGALGEPLLPRDRGGRGAALVPNEDLLIANSMAIVGETVALLVGVFVGGWLGDLVADDALVIGLAGGEWVVASAVATRVRAPRAAPCARGGGPGRAGAGRPGVRRRIRRLARTPRALGPIWSITLDQMGQGWCSCSRCSCSGTGWRKAWDRSRT